jgi:DNA-binding response OmpR family regulator
MSYSTTKATTNHQRLTSSSISINLTNTKFSVLHYASKELNWVTADDTEWDIYWSDAANGVERLIRNARSYQKVNHFPGMVNIQ